MTNYHARMTPVFSLGLESKHLQFEIFPRENLGNSSGPVTTAPFKSLTPGETATEMSDTSKEDEISLEQFLDDSDSYRSSSVVNPWPYPLTLEHAPHLQLEILPLREKIRDILNIHGFSESVDFLPFEATKPQYPGGDIPINLLRVILRAEDHTPAQLSPAKDDILELLRGKGILNIEVEIINIDLCFCPSVFVLSSCHPIVIAFENTKDEIIEILHHDLGSNWNVLCPFGIGRSEQKSHPAIVVNVDPMTCANWSNLDSKIKGKISKHVQEDKVKVEFFPGSLSLLQSRGTSFADRMNPNGSPVMGDSIGICGEGNAGTLGEYVTLTQNGKAQKGFVTSYHAVRPSGLDSETEPFLESLDRYGGSLLRLPGQAIQIESLATIDQDATMVHIEQILKNMHDQIQDLSIKIETRDQMGARPLPTLQKKVEECESAILDLHNKQHIAQQMPNLMGNIAAASGKAILGGRFMDWAFIQPTETAARKFFGPNTMFPVPSNQMPYLYGANLGFPLPEETPLTEFGRLEKDRYYTKLGRSTGVTSGICHGALACCNWKEKYHIRYQHDGQQVEVSPNVTEEFVIVSKRQVGGDFQQSSFAESGDSGSFVVNVDGQVCGLLYGATSGTYGPPGHSHVYANAGLATDLAELSNSIKLTTTPKDAHGNIIDTPAELGLPGDF